MRASWRLATAESDIDAFMTDWQTPELRQTHDVQNWCANPQNIDLQEQLRTLARVYKPEFTVLDVGCYAGYLSTGWTPSRGTTWSWTSCPKP